MSQLRKPAARAPGKKGGKPELSEEQKQEIREAFDLFDTDGSGGRTTTADRAARVAVEKCWAGCASCDAVQLCSAEPGRLVRLGAARSHASR
jgi:hypothetical protein